MQKQTFAPKNILIKAIEKVKSSTLNANSNNQHDNKLKKATINRSMSLKDSNFKTPLSNSSNNNNNNNNNTNNSIHETPLVDNDLFISNDSQSTISNRTSLDELNEDYVTSIKSSEPSNVHASNKYEMNYSETRSYRMMNYKFSDTYKDIITNLLTEKLINYAQQYHSYLPEGHTFSNDDVESLDKYKLRQLEKRNQLKKQKILPNMNRRSSNSFNAGITGIKPAIKQARGVTAVEKQRPSVVTTEGHNVVNFVTRQQQKRPSTYSISSAGYENNPENLPHSNQENLLLFKKSPSKSSYKSLSTSVAHAWVMPNRPILNA